ncbi:diol dehydratase reactivase subunit alpha [Hydrogeniiclostridium mannosilyticum]|uniref:diol dehydratase reactivase subunit alpha n=1 Tax=Hydrogeniiclostridium mannosilyticum TaxID=2764322 RepID=UPI0039997E1B
MAFPSKIVAGIDIGNSTTEAILMDKGAEKPVFLSSSMTATTGVKGTLKNVEGCVTALNGALSSAGLTAREVTEIRINQAAPVISNLSMDTVSETVVIGSAMIGHNPDTPGGEGLALGLTVPIERLAGHTEEVVAIIDDCPYYRAATLLNKAFADGVKVVGAIVRSDDGVLIANRLTRIIPIVDEVKGISKVEKNVLAAVEVAGNGESIKTLSNPYGIAGLFHLTPQETKDSIPVARSLTGCRSGVVIRAQGAQVNARKIPAGTIRLTGDKKTEEINVNDGADAIMAALERVGTLMDATGEEGTNVGGLLSSIKQTMAELTEQQAEDMRISGILAADTFAATKVEGALAGEHTMENVVMLAAMVKTSHLHMNRIARELQTRMQIPVVVSGKEAEMALKGALTTPGSQTPLAILDLGGGSTDAALIDSAGHVTSIHHAGAGEMVTRIINLELNLDDRDTAELIKKFPLAKVEGLLYLRFEDSSVKFVSEPLPPQFYSRIVVVTDQGLVPVRSDKKLTIDKIANVRRMAKKKVFLANAQRALKAVAPDGEIRRIGSVVLVGGSSQDFEIADILSEYLNNYRIAAGRANLLGFLPPPSAVALGLALSD